MRTRLGVFFLSWLTFSVTSGDQQAQEVKRWTVQPSLLRNGVKTAWSPAVYRKLAESGAGRSKRSPPGSDLQIVLDGQGKSMQLHLTPRSRHPVTADTVFEWVAEDGQRTMWRGVNTDHCWYSGHVDDRMDSTVWLGICDGLSGIIRHDNEMLLLEPDADDPSRSRHVLYQGRPRQDLKQDQHFGRNDSNRRSKRNSRYRVDYDELGMEITNTIQLEDLPDYHLTEDDEDEDEDLAADLDEDAVISDSLVDIEDYDVHPPPVVITHQVDPLPTPSKPYSNEITEEENPKPEFDGFSVDKLWEVPEDMLPQSGNRKKPVTKTTVRVDPPKWLEMALAVDHTVIRFHGKQRVQQYVLTLLNIVSAIYEDTSLEANLQMVVSRLVFYEDRKQGQVREGNSKRSLENVNAWNAGLLRNTAADRPHDIAVWLTRYELGGPAGYAPVAGVCDPDRSCSLNRDEGLTSAFIIAHEIGHVLGFSHDGDMTFGNDCSEEALQGSVMAGMVGATFSRFHWSRCTHWEYHFKQQNWKCMKNQPHSSSNITVIPSSIQYSYSLDEQCRMEFGEGYYLCRSFALNDPCTHLWCGHRSSPQLCKTKKGPPLEGTPCADNKWCIKGFCESIGKRKKNVGPVVKNPRDGSWSEWRDWNACSRTCGLGIRFRIRKCDNPPPANGGRSCEGSGEEFEVCNTQPCPKLSDFRAEQCPLLAQLNSTKMMNLSLTWLPWELNNQSSLCKLTCIAAETRQVVQSNENVIDGTACSYEDPHGVCVQGRCEPVGCDHRLASTARENECGICNGKASDCSLARRLYSGSPKPPYRRVAVIPRGARNIRIREETNSSNRLALKPRSSKQWVLNATYPVSDANGSKKLNVIWSGTRFTYTNKNGMESIRSRGPLLADLSLMVVPGPTRQQVNVSVSWSRPSKAHRKKNPNVGVDGVGDRYVWELAGWSPCSRTCGEGTQSQVWHCRDRKTNHVVRRKHCLPSYDELTIATRLCNTFRCDFRWVTGEWEGCSRTCGDDGTQMRLVYCVRTSMVNSATVPFTWDYGNKFAYYVPHETVESDSLGGYEARRQPEVIDDDSDNGTGPMLELDTWKPTTKDFKKKVASENEVLVWHPNAIADPSLCRDQRPEETQSCNRQPCPGAWVEKLWTKCSATCGTGQQEMQFACLVKSKSLKERPVEGASAAFTSPEVPFDEEVYSNGTEVPIGQWEAASSANVNNRISCGPKPTLTRPCSTSVDCPSTTGMSEPCEKESLYCQLPFFRGYCAVAQFRQACCQTCAENWTQPTN